MPKIFDNFKLIPVKVRFLIFVVVYYNFQVFVHDFVCYFDRLDLHVEEPSIYYYYYYFLYKAALISTLILFTAIVILLLRQQYFGTILNSF